MSPRWASWWGCGVAGRWLSSGRPGAGGNSVFLKGAKRKGQPLTRSWYGSCAWTGGGSTRKSTKLFILSRGGLPPPQLPWPYPFWSDQVSTTSCCTHHLSIPVPTHGSSLHLVLVAEFSSNVCIYRSWSGQEGPELPKAIRNLTRFKPATISNQQHQDPKGPGSVCTSHEGTVPTRGAQAGSETGCSSNDRYKPS